uniref:hypothetical protein n=1 Tax=Cephaloticoccus sp. TaxID=1985742 RepID=UPI00404AB013
MIYFWVSFGLALHLLFWGAGLAMLCAPKRWGRFWPIWIAPAGVALQSIVVWVGAHTTMAGTDVYAGWSELLPLGLLILGLRRSGWREALRGLTRFAGLWAVMALVLTLLTLPLAYSSNLLTTSSIGSCDAADYAAGARVFQEFSSTDRTGFMGQTEVVQVGSTDNFFEFWLRLNHFTPSALIALNSTVFGLQPYQATGVLTVMLVVLVLPLVFWVARTLNLSSLASLWLAFIYGVSPISWYAAAHVAPAQLLAAMGIALVTSAAVMAWRDRKYRAWSYTGLLGIGFVILWGSYNFIVVVCLIPAVGCVGGWALARGEIAAFFRWLGCLATPLVLSGLFFYERVAGVAERFLLFQQTDFGWTIAALWPEGWLGMVANTGLEPWGMGWGVLMSVVILGLWFTALFRMFTHNGKAVWRIIAFTCPVLVGYGYLEFQGWRHDDNSSYDAYKLFAVFHPVLLVALCPWLVWLRRDCRWHLICVGAMVIITAGNLYTMRAFADRMSRGLLVVESNLPELQVLESYAQVDSVNLMVPQLWERLWSNSFLLRKKQFLDVSTYEGRLPTGLHGEWDLNGGLMQIKLPGEDSIKINNRYSIVRTGSPWFIRATFDEGWHKPELWRARKTRYWRWSFPVGWLAIENTQERPLSVVLHLECRNLEARDLEIWVDQEHQQNLHLGTDIATISTRPLLIGPGRSKIALKVGAFTGPTNGSDQRLLGVAVYAITVEVLPDI